MAEFDYTFSGQLEWEIDAQCFETDIAAEALERDMLATRETWTAVEKNIIGQFSILLSCTRSVKRVGKKKPAPAVLQMVELVNKHPAPDEMVAWRFKLPYKLRSAWEGAWTDAQDMFSVDPSQLPDEALTSEQQEQLKDKNSFLAGGG
jgi:hypothetical protein